MKTKYNDPSKAPWWSKHQQQGTQEMPVFDGPTRFASIRELSNGLIHSHADFRDFAEYRKITTSMFPDYTRREQDWTYGDQSKEDTNDQWDRGIAPGEWARDLYNETRDLIKAGFIQADLSRCRTNKRKRVKAWAGGSVNVPRYLESRMSGKPAPVFRQLSKRASRPVIRLGLNTMASCGCDRRDFIRVSAMVASMTEKLEAMGYGVEIVACYALYDPCYRGKTDLAPDGEVLPFKYDSRWISCSFPIKRASERLDVERVMSVGQVGTFRDLGFRSMWVQHGCHNYGSTQCLSVPDEVVMEGMKLDCMIETSWSRDGGAGMAERVAGKIKQIVGQD